MECRYRKKQPQWDYEINSVTWSHASTTVFCGSGYCDTECSQLPFLRIVTALVLPLALTSL